MNGIPATDLIVEVLDELARTAQAAGDKVNVNALNKAAFEVLGGLAIRTYPNGDLLIPSRTTVGQIYRVSHDRVCSCAAGAAGKPCWHAAVSEAVVVARDLAAQLADDAASAFDAYEPARLNDEEYARVLRDIEECY